MYEITKEDLEEKMKSILSLENNKTGLISAERNYIGYLGESKELARIIRRLALEEKIKRTLLQDIYMIFVAPQFFVRDIKEEEFETFIRTPMTYPAFWDDSMERKFHFEQYLKDFSSLSHQDIAFSLALWNYKEISYSSILDKKISNKIYAHAKKSLKDIKSFHSELMHQIGAPMTENTKGSKEAMKPYIHIEKNMGYLKSYSRSRGIPIGGENTRQVRLLQTLTEPSFGIQKSIETIFEAIRIERKDAANSKLNSTAFRKREILDIIDYTKKELQKKLGGKISFHSNSNKTAMWIRWEG